MDADSDHGGHEGIMLFRMDHHTMQAVVIEYPVIDPFRCRALIIDFFCRHPCRAVLPYKVGYPIRVWSL